MQNKDSIEFIKNWTQFNKRIRAPLDLLHAHRSNFFYPSKIHQLILNSNFQWLLDRIVLVVKLIFKKCPSSIYIVTYIVYRTENAELCAKGIEDMVYKTNYVWSDFPIKVIANESFAFTNGSGYLWLLTTNELTNLMQIR